RSEFAEDGTGLPRRLRNLLYTGGYEHMVQSAPQCSLCVSGNAAGGQLHTTRDTVHERTQFRHAGVGKRRFEANHGELHGIRSKCSRTIRTAVEYTTREE